MKAFSSNTWNRIVCLWIPTVLMLAFATACGGHALHGAGPGYIAERSVKCAADTLKFCHVAWSSKIRNNQRSERCSCRPH